MTTEIFNAIIHEQINRCEETLCDKAEEYATADRLHNFKQAAALQGIEPTTALAGMMCKHTVSIYDMIGGLEIGKTYPIEMWNEKIGDSINYLLLLAALIRETGPEAKKYDFDPNLNPGPSTGLPTRAESERVMRMMGDVLSKAFNAQ